MQRKPTPMAKDGWVRARYEEQRIRILIALDEQTESGFPRALRRLARFAFVAVDLPIRWLCTLVGSFLGDRGYIAFGTVVGGYFFIYGLIDARHNQDEAQATFERAQFVTLVSAGHQGAFVAAMRDFARVQNLVSLSRPSPLIPSPPNADSLRGSPTRA
jgi:hypothetical protein